MRLITAFEAARRTKTELRVLFRQAAEAAAQTGGDAPSRRAAQASRENIRRELKRRQREP